MARIVPRPRITPSGYGKRKQRAEGEKSPRKTKKSKKKRAKRRAIQALTEYQGREFHWKTRDAVGDCDKFSEAQAHGTNTVATRQLANEPKTWSVDVGRIKNNPKDVVLHFDVHGIHTVTQHPPPEAQEHKHHGNDGAAT